MAGFWGNRAGEQRPAVSADFQHALGREVMRTELVRVRALIITASALILIIWTIHIFDPEVVQRVWHGSVTPAYLYAILIVFILFEVWVHGVISHNLKLDRDVAPI